ncbi:unnamed protein product [Closterium sp. NIES-53]
MAAQELRWFTYLLTDLGEQPRSPPVLYVVNKAMIALCQEHRLEHRTKHIALRYFLARELQQRGQLRLAYVATQANTDDIFTKALPPACFAFLDWCCDHLFSPTLPMGVSGSTPLLVSPPVTPDFPLALPPWSPLPATPAWHALLPPCWGAGAGDPAESRAAGTRGAGAGGTGTGGTGGGGAGAGGTGEGGAGVGGAGAVDPGAGSDGAGGAISGDIGAGGTVRPRPYFDPLLQQVLGVPSSTSLTPPLLCPLPDHSHLPLQPASPLPALSPYTEQSGGHIERREPESRPVSPIRTARRVPRPRPPPITSTHAMALLPSSFPQRVPLLPPPKPSLPAVPDPESDRARAASPTISCLLATVVTDPTFESTSASAVVAELLDFAAACRLDYATALVAKSESASPPSIGGECALATDVLEDRKEDFECLAVAVPRFASMLLAPEGDPDAPDIPTLRSYAEAIMGPYSSQ